MRTPVLLPELGAGNDKLRISCWLADWGDPVDSGDRLVEVLLDGVTFDVIAEHSGILARIERSMDHEVRAGDVLGWIETEPGAGSE
jgi:pyruvate/2-oxoglutarate dehydrogenase complex dihydrolipoamide acyltransferase (E2) component